MIVIKPEIYDSDSSKNLSLVSLVNIFSEKDVSRIYYKSLSPNDNSKNQPYMGGHLTDLGFLPTGEIIDSPSTSRKTKDPKRQIKYTATLNYFWMSAEGRLYKAPNAKLIYYPQYPEVRFSGFLVGADFDMGGWMDPARKGRSQGRVLFFGIKNNGEILAYLSTPESRIAKEIHDYSSTELSGVFRELLIPRTAKASQPDMIENLHDKASYEGIADVSGQYSMDFTANHQPLSSRDALISELKRIHLKRWIESKRLDKKGIEMPYAAPNGGGYTMEAELGVIPNGNAEPDFMGWEVKQFSVKRFDLINSKPLTLMTPEPNGGVYVDAGVESFVRQYGRPSTRGIDNRYDFTGKHVANSVCSSTGLTLVTDGYDAESSTMTNGSGSIALLDNKGVVASSWSFPKLMEIWKNKHSKAVYIPSISRKEEGHLKQYYYGNQVRLFEGTSILQLLKAVSEGHVYYDPGIKLENADTVPRTKRRSQFRIKSASLDKLYDREDDVDVLKNQPDLVVVSLGQMSDNLSHI